MILDATCGLKQMWFKKDDQETIYLDMRYGAIQYTEKQFKRNTYIYSFHSFLVKYSNLKQSFNLENQKYSKGEQKMLQ